MKAQPTLKVMGFLLKGPWKQEALPVAWIWRKLGRPNEAAISTDKGVHVEGLLGGEAFFTHGALSPYLHTRGQGSKDLTDQPES